MGADPTAASQVRRVDDPVDGARSPATPESAAAAEALRDDSHHRGRWGRQLGRYAAMPFLVVVLIGGWLASRAFQDGEDAGRAAERAENDGFPTANAASVDDTDTADDAAAPLGSGGLLDAVVRARALAAAAGTTAESPASLAFAVRSTSADGAIAAARYDYDLLADAYVATVQPRSGTLTRYEFDASWRSTIRLDGVVERVPRSVDSLDPAPDVALARLLTLDDAVPPAAGQFLTPIVHPTDGPQRLGDGRYAYRVDIAAFRRAEPDAFDRWRALWRPTLPDDASLVTASGAQRLGRLAGSTVIDGIAPVEVVATMLAGDTPGNTIAVELDPDGTVGAVRIVAPDAGFSTDYALLGRDVDVRLTDLGGTDAWVDVP